MDGGATRPGQTNTCERTAETAAQEPSTQTAVQHGTPTSTAVGDTVDVAEDLQVNRRGTPTSTAVEDTAHVAEDLQVERAIASAAVEDTAAEDLQVEGAERAIASAERERVERRQRIGERAEREDMNSQDETTNVKDTGGVGNKYEHLYKILIIGELGTGKTSIIKRYVHQFFSAHYRATIGVDFALKVLHWDPNTIVRLQLWDIAGQERFGSMTRVYYKEAVAAFVVFDASRSVTFDAVMKWKNDLDEKVQLPNGDPVPCVLLGNKSDLPSEGLATKPDKVSAWAAEHGFVGCFPTSAKENKGIEDAAHFLVSKILAHEREGNLAGEGEDTDAMAVSDGQPSSSSCAC